MRRFLFATIIGLATLVGMGAAPPKAHARWYSTWYSPYGMGNYGTYWQTTTTPLGSYSWYGYQPQMYTYAPYSFQSFPAYSYYPYGYAGNYYSMYPNYSWYYYWW